ncbi:interactor of constitutive active ROPs 2, chloroplastic-like [Coffea arabica]|uniref:Interactor of constitutive active ROPs 2, chloroplastic-like n=1 Tax=Coffea arabica TaxID=13443 RepID=A0A6P6V8G3_COFAR|nr:interactor of constitutive active ROPs 2, chloroplastic-like [Coffea arabica]XP_027098225.1 interactor of constitutive active ROPs 2, chloroplastic-like [Coffea arabica]XP_027098226.1 interactor of constitutive active ROPs 2, chloroplastic-like [Coffea arabica]XP_027098227.1 interactor of constitutive active ROPs 2, chloroplastic-like [Coffea arabica]
MQTPKGRTSSSELPQKTSPATPRTAQKLKTPGSEADSVSTSNSAGRMSKERSPKVVDRRSPRSPATEKKRTTRVSDLETQLAQLQEELKKAKDQLSSSESRKKRAQQEAEEAKKQLEAMSEKLEESEKQLQELSDCEEARVQELRKISQDRDRAWQSELEAIQKQHSMDSAALASAMNEIQKLKMQLERVAESEAAQARHAESAHADVQNLRMELTETLALVDEIKAQLNDSKESEVRAMEEVSKAQMQLEEAKATEDTLRSEGLRAEEAYKSLALKLEQSKMQVNSLEELVSRLQADVNKRSNDSSASSGDVEIAREKEGAEKSEQLKVELNSIKLEVGHLRAALEASERRYQEEYIQSTLQIRSAYELVEKTKSESCQREAELEARLKVARADVEELKKRLMDKETELKNTAEKNKGLNGNVERDQCIQQELGTELKKSESIVEALKASLMDKETELQSVAEENEMLKLEIKNRELERSKLNDEALALVEAARATEQEALSKLSYLTDEADQSSRKTARVTEQLDAAQAANSEMEAELRRLKVQADQWRKAAEAAATMLSTGNNGKFVERTGSLDYHTLGGKLNSPYSEDLDDDSPKKKNSNMLKKIGVLLKKGQK